MYMYLAFAPLLLKGNPPSFYGFKCTLSIPFKKGVNSRSIADHLLHCTGPSVHHVSPLAEETFKSQLN